MADAQIAKIYDIIKASMDDLTPAQIREMIMEPYIEGKVYKG